MKLGTFSKEVPIFISEAASLRTAVSPVMRMLVVPTRISGTSKLGNYLP